MNWIVSGRTKNDGANNMIPMTILLNCVHKPIIVVTGAKRPNAIDTYNLKHKYWGIFLFFKLKCFLIHLGGKQ